MLQKKQIFKLNILKKLLDDEHSCVSLVPTTRLLALPPFSLNDTKSGILYLLNCMLKKYDRSLGGLVIGYQNVKVLMDENTGIIPMGTAEIEVNISVEFFIFQPKIGSFLEGMINKKSNNHIGCLVHQYFNATILKPEDVDFDDWICKDFNVNDKIIFKVKDLDFTRLIPYIEGVVEESFLHKSISKSNEKCDISNVSTDVQDELSKRLGSEDSNSKLLENTKFKDAHEEKFEASETSVNSKLTNSNTNSKKDEKKKRKDGNKKEREKHSNKRESTESCDDLGFKANETFDKKKKRKKKEKEEDVIGSFNSSDHFIKEDGKDYLSLHNEDSTDFVRPVKEKNEEKKKKKQMKENESLNETLTCLPSRGEDDVFCSTQLEPKLKSKMTVSFCSPIPRASSSMLSVTQSSPSKTRGVEKEKKKKDKKRSREEEDEVEGVPKKKTKILSASPSKIEDFNSKMSRTQNLMEESCKDELKKTVDGLNRKEQKSTKKMSKQDRKETQSEDSTDRVKAINGSEKTSDEHDSCHELHKQDSSGKKELSGSGNESAGKKSKKDKSLKAKANSKSCEVGSSGEEKKIGEESTDKSNNKGKKKSKTAENKREVSSNDSLCEKLLREAKNVLDLGNYKPSTSRPTKEAGKITDKKDSELSDWSTGSSKRKKGKHKEKKKDCSGLQESFKNGSMYDVVSSPEKRHPDKSLFTDSEQSMTSPAKKRVEVNGIEAVKKPQVQNKSSVLCNEKATKTKSESGREVSKDSKKTKSKGKLVSSGSQRDSIYEKLMEQAKKLIDLKENSKNFL